MVMMCGPTPVRIGGVIPFQSWIVAALAVIGNAAINPAISTIVRTYARTRV
jgi:hypothetical protein